MRVLLKIGSALSLLYYLLIISYAGIKTTFGKFWLAASGGLYLISILPGKLFLWFFSWIQILFPFFLYKEIQFVKAAHAKPEEDGDYVIILGAQVKGERPSRSLLRRIEAGAIYLKRNPECKVIASGGQGKNEAISEAECIARVLREIGIDENRILLEPDSTSTWENLSFSMKIGGENRRYVVVTNGFHMYRTLMTGKKLGMTNLSGLSASSEPVLLLNYYVREFFAWILYRGRMK